MHRLDELHLEHPSAGSRMLRDILRDEGIPIGREKVVPLMRRMGISTLYRRMNVARGLNYPLRKVKILRK